MPLPRSLANLKRKISEEKWVEAWRWAGGRTSKTKYRMPKSQRPDGTVAASTMACLTVLPDQDGALPDRAVPQLTKKRPTPQCWWCRYPNQTWENRFKVRPEWRMEQKIPWAEVQKETGRWKSRWKVRDLLADGRCSRVVLDFLTTTEVGKTVPVVEEDAGSEASQWELRERTEREEERRAEAGVLGTGVEPPQFLPTPLL